jgi:hypothetical protein
VPGDDFDFGLVDKTHFRCFRKEKDRETESVPPGLKLFSAGLEESVQNHRLRRVNGNLLALLILVFELHNAIDQGKDCEIASNSDVFSGVELRSALTTDNLSALHGLSAIDFHSEHLWIAVATVLCTTTGFFMCHFSTLYIGSLGRRAARVEASSLWAAPLKSCYFFVLLFA